MTTFLPSHMIACVTVADVQIPVPDDLSVFAARPENPEAVDGVSHER
jgi:hypothetical protein